MRRSQVLVALCILLACVATGATPVVANSAPLAEDEVTLVVHTAVDCPVCKAWRESSSGFPLLRQLRQGTPPIKWVIVERPSLQGSESEALYPPELAPLFKARQEKYQLSPPTPLFELVRAGKVVSRHAGLRGWAEGTLPEIRQIQGNLAPSSASP